MCQHSFPERKHKSVPGSHETFLFYPALNSKLIYSAPLLSQELINFILFSFIWNEILSEFKVHFEKINILI